MAQKEFRKPPRYMVGDIVYSHGFICIVCSIYPFNIDYSYDLKVIDGQSLGKICQNDIMHVHIWEEFLKKNGWTCYRSEGECFGHRWYKHQEYPFTLRYNNFLGIIGVSFNDGKDDTVMIKCVDELQHMLQRLSVKMISVYYVLEFQLLSGYVEEPVIISVRHIRQFSTQMSIIHHIILVDILQM